MAYRIVRVAKLEPWYHATRPRCVTTTLQGEQCTFSAKYEGVNNSSLTVCKTHRDMLPPEVKVRLIRPETVHVR